MIKLSAAIDRSFSGFIRDYGLRTLNYQEAATWSQCDIEGKGVRLEFYAEAVDHYASCRIIVDNVDWFECGLVASELFGAQQIQKAIDAKHDLYKDKYYGRLLQEIDSQCDFIVVYLWPLFEGCRIQTPTYLFDPSQNNGWELKHKLVAHWIRCQQPDLFG